MVKSLRMFKVGDHGEVPAPEVYWMKDFDKWQRLCFYSFLADTSDGYVLVNTGLPDDLTLRNRFLREWAGSERCRFSAGEDQKIENALARIGLSPRDVARVIVTPIQDYALGRLNLFDRARIYLSRRGWLAEVATPDPARQFLSRDIYLPLPIRRYLFEDAWERIVLVGDEQRIAEGVSVRWTGCHHRSSMAVVVDAPDGRVVITDAAFTQRNLKESLPIGICESVFECYDTYEYLKHAGAKVIPAYDPDNLEKFKEYAS